MVYLESGRFAARVRELLPSVYSCTAGVYHYRSMAKTNYRAYLKGDVIPLKKYFYVLRPLLSIRWIERYGKPAPIEFSELLHLLNDESTLRADINSLLERKRSAPEMGLAEPVASIGAFIERELERVETLQMDFRAPDGDMEQLNEVFRAAINE